MIGLIALAAATLSPQAGPGVDDPDLACIAVFSLAISRLPEQEKAGVAAGVMYFVGRIDGRATGTDIEAGIRRVVAGFSQDQIRAEATRCGAIMTERGRYLQDVGAALQGR